MKQLIDRIAASCIGLIVLVFVEGIITLGAVFKLEEYNWMGYSLQGMMIFLAIWAANKAYEAETGK
jgi:uncharacterized membrane protein